MRYEDELTLRLELDDGQLELPVRRIRWMMPVTRRATGIVVSSPAEVITFPGASSPPREDEDP